MWTCERWTIMVSGKWFSTTLYPLNQLPDFESYSTHTRTHTHNCTLFHRKTCAQQMHGKVYSYAVCECTEHETITATTVSTHRLSSSPGASHLIREKTRCVWSAQLPKAQYFIILYTWPTSVIGFIDIDLWPCKERRWAELEKSPLPLRPAWETLSCMLRALAGAPWKQVDSHTHTYIHTHTHTHMLLVFIWKMQQSA